MRFESLTKLVAYLQNDSYVEEQLGNINIDKLQNWALILVYVYKYKEKGVTHAKLTNYLLHENKLQPSVYLPIIRKLVSRSILTKQGNLYTYYNLSALPITSLDISSYKTELSRTTAYRSNEIFSNIARITSHSSYSTTRERLEGFSKYIKSSRLTNNKFTISDVMCLTPYLTRKLVTKELEKMVESGIVSVTSVLIGGRYHAQYSLLSKLNDNNYNTYNNINNDIDDTNNNGDNDKEENYIDIKKTKITEKSHLILHKDLKILESLIEHPILSSNLYNNNNNNNNDNNNKTMKKTISVTFKEERTSTIKFILQQHNNCLEINKLLNLIETQLNNNIWKKSTLKVINESEELTNFYVLKRYSFTNALRIATFITLKYPTDNSRALLFKEAIKNAKYYSLSMDTLILDHKQNYEIKNYEFCNNLSLLFGYNCNKEVVKHNLVNALYRVVKKNSFYIVVENISEHTFSKEIEYLEMIPVEYEEVRFSNYNDIDQMIDVNNNSNLTINEGKGTTYGFMKTDENLIKKKNSPFSSLLCKLLSAFNILDLLFLIGIQNYNVAKNYEKFEKFMNSISRELNENNINMKNRSIKDCNEYLIKTLVYKNQNIVKFWSLLNRFNIMKRILYRNKETNKHYMVLEFDLNFTSNKSNKHKEENDIKRVKIYINNKTDKRTTAIVKENPIRNIYDLLTQNNIKDRGVNKPYINKTNLFKTIGCKLIPTLSYYTSIHKKVYSTTKHTKTLDQEVKHSCSFKGSNENFYYFIMYYNSGLYNTTSNIIQIADKLNLHSFEACSVCIKAICDFNTNDKNNRVLEGVFNNISKFIKTPNMASLYSRYFEVSKSIREVNAPILTTMTTIATNGNNKKESKRITMKPFKLVKLLNLNLGNNHFIIQNLVENYINKVINRMSKEETIEVLINDKLINNKIVINKFVKELKKRRIYYIDNHVYKKPSLLNLLNSSNNNRSIFKSKKDNRKDLTLFVRNQLLNIKEFETINIKTLALKLYYEYKDKKKDNNTIYKINSLYGIIKKLVKTEIVMNSHFIFVRVNKAKSKHYLKIPNSDIIYNENNVLVFNKHKDKKENEIIIRNTGIHFNEFKHSLKLIKNSIFNIIKINKSVDFKTIYTKLNSTLTKADLKSILRVLVLDKIITETKKYQTSANINNKLLLDCENYKDICHTLKSTRVYTINN